jgi:hypothetical protein
MCAQLITGQAEHHFLINAHCSRSFLYNFIRLRPAILANWQSGSVS